ncbi:LysR family transcriptional regulator [Paraburkholderia graminis]|uniref:LysR family transcriptional regulator n=1 Tax=Paraburkholderia graminis TaxID=60548 RepID=UPI0027927276|nr:LysR family transcriptional regulator [Paraburkholderia graminis]MDQ0625949.1 DNA-binding transcriptional LysR family regulator [Paraburkholderia graminis]
MNRTIGGFNLDDLVAVLTVAEHRSFRGAARALELPPSSLSHIVSAVERRLGIRIFHRTTRSVSPTEAGQAFIDRMCPALTEMADAFESVNRFRDTPYGQVRINTSNWAAERAFPVILDFLAAYPEVSIDIVAEGRLVDIVAEGFDAGLRLAEAVPQDMVAVPLSGDEAVIIVASPGYLHKCGTPRAPPDLLHHECIRLRLPGGGLMRWEVAKAGERSWIDVRGRLIVGASEFALSAAVAGVGIAYVDAAKAIKCLESGLLVQLLSEWTPPFAGVCLYYPRQRLPSAAFRAFIDHVKAHTAASVSRPPLGM